MDNIQVQVVWRRNDTKDVVPANQIISGSWAQDLGLSPWGDYVWVNPDGSLDLGGESMPPSHAFETCHCEESCEWDWDAFGSAVEAEWELPTRRSDGALREGDWAVGFVHGNSGTYQQRWVWDGSEWECTEDTLPWKMKV